MKQDYGDVDELVKRLRSIGADIVSDDKDRRDAADCIESLKAQLKNALAASDDLTSKPRPTPSPGLDPTLHNDAYNKKIER